MNQSTDGFVSDTTLKLHYSGSLIQVESPHFRIICSTQAKCTVHIQGIKPSTTAIGQQSMAENRVELGSPTSCMTTRKTPACPSLEVQSVVPSHLNIPHPQYSIATYYKYNANLRTLICFKISRAGAHTKYLAT